VAFEQAQLLADMVAVAHCRSEDTVADYGVPAGEFAADEIRAKCG
jgi:hypothetical protein